MAAELPRPGVEVVQVIRSSSPTVVTPTLMPCVVGVAKQIVELLETDSSGSRILNGDALVSLPAYFLANDASGTPKVYGGLNGLQLVMSPNNAPNVTVLFADAAGAGLTPTTVVGTINRALAAAGVTSILSEVVGDAFRVRSIGVGPYQSIRVDGTTSPAVLSAFGIGAEKTYLGTDGYDQLIERIPATNYPDPRGNLGELSIEADSIRVFLAMSATNFIEALRTEAFLRNGVVDNAATLTGTVDFSTLTLPGDLTGKTLILTIDGAATAQTVSFTASETSPALAVAKINSATTGLTAELTPTTNYLKITSDLTGAASSILIGAGSATTIVGFTLAQTAVGTSIEVIDDGNGDNFSPLLKFLGHDFTSVGVAAAVTGSVAINGLVYPTSLAGKTLEISDGQQLQTIEFSATIANEAAVLSEINAVVGAASGGKAIATVNGSHHLVLTSTEVGADSMLWIKAGTAVTTLGLTADTLAYGSLGHVAAGDQLYIDGLPVGYVTAVAPGGQTNVLKMDAQFALSLDYGARWHVIAKNLTGTGVDRPTPNLTVDSNKNVILKVNLIRDTVGAPVHPTMAHAPVYVAYTAVRKDVTSLAASPGLLRFDSQTQLADTLSPIDTRNPLALGLFFAMVNAPGIQVAGLGVDAISADSPFGTSEAFARAAEYLEAYEVYAIAPLTHDATVGQTFNTHVQFMSEPDQKGERIALFNSEQPSTALDTLVASGANGNSVGSTGLVLDTGIPNLAALLLTKGISTVGTIATTSGLFLDIGSDAKNYSISAVSGSQITIRTTFTPGTNDDSFYSTTPLNTPPLPSQLIGETFAVKIRGAALVTVNGDPDRQKIAETYTSISQAFGHRRFWHTAPDSCAATISGVEQVIQGFYMNAGIVGMIGQQPPQQSFTNFPMAGYTRVIGSNDFFTERQMNIMAAGGTYIIVQDAQSAPLISRMALTTDMQSIETRTDSITKVVDFVAKFLRRALKNFIGRFNITQAFLDQLGTVAGGVGGFLVEAGVLIGFNLNNIIQDESSPDTVLIDVLLDVPYPCNYIRLTLVL